MKIIQLLIVSIIFCNAVRADISRVILQKYKKNDLFICVGIHSCETLANALNIGYQELHGVDEDEILINHARIIFPKDLTDNVNKVSKDYHIHHGNIEIFKNIVNNINKSMTIHFNNHYFGMDTVVANDILDQLDILKLHPIKNHVILIDDIIHEGKPEFGSVSLVDINNKLLEINPEYVVVFDRGGHLENEDNAVLIAYIK